MAGSFDFLHIKRRTAGSSNELSLDVLDHKSAEAAEKAGKAQKLIKAPKPSQGSYHGVAGTATLSGQAEVEKRKRARHAHKLRLTVIGVIAVAALVGVGIFAAVQYHDNQKNAANRVSGLVDRLSQVDETLVEIDGMMGDPFSEEQASQRAAALSKAPKLSSELNRIVVDAQSLSGFLVDDKAEIAARQVAEAARARSDMIAAAQSAFSLSSEAAQQIDRANRVWNDVLNADQLAREAMSMANKATTPEATTQSLEATREALNRFNTALGELRDIRSSYDVDFGSQEAYLEKKVEALEKSAETSEALLAGNRDAATKANEAYTEADAMAANLAEELPASIGGLVQTQFENSVIEYQRRYDAARGKAVEADSVIRGYLGR